MDHSNFIINHLMDSLLFLDSENQLSLLFSSVSSENDHFTSAFKEIYKEPVIKRFE